MRTPTSAISQRFTESVIREMTRLIALHHGDRGINLAQGFPDFPAPQALKDAACAAIQADVNQYAITWGNRAMREAVADKLAHFYGWRVDPETEITVCCGATECLVSTLLAVVDPGDEVIIFEPWYENYGPDCIVAGAVPRYIPLEPPEWGFDVDRLRSLFTPRTRAIVVNTPHNPTGKVFTRHELETIAALCIEHDVIAITDEIYEHLVYEGEHIPLATIDGMAQRTVTVNGLSKTYAVTGWRLGYTVAQAAITNAIRKVHDFLTVGAAAPLQAAAATALRLPDTYYTDLLEGYRQRRAHMLATLTELELPHTPPQGAYYVMADISSLGRGDDVEFTQTLIREHGVAVVPGSSFYAERELGRNLVRFAFPKRIETLDRARAALQGLRAAPAAR